MCCYCTPLHNCAITIYYTTLLVRCSHSVTVTVEITDIDTVTMYAAYTVSTGWYR